MGSPNKPSRWKAGVRRDIREHGMQYISPIRTNFQIEMDNILNNITDPMYRQARDASDVKLATEMHRNNLAGTTYAARRHQNYNNIMDNLRNQSAQEQQRLNNLRFSDSELDGFINNTTDAYVDNLTWRTDKSPDWHRNAGMEGIQSALDSGFTSLTEGALSGAQEGVDSAKSNMQGHLNNTNRTLGIANSGSAASPYTSSLGGTPSPNQTPMSTSGSSSTGSAPRFGSGRTTGSVF